MREQDYLARAGYVVLHTDYRNHAQSDDDPTAELELRLGYTEDVINAVLAVKRSTLPNLDKERIGLLGRSMGGGVTLNALVVQPGLVDAAVVFAPVSSNTVDNFNRWIRGDPGRDRLADQIIERYGSPERNPQFWRDVSPRTFFNRITEPILIHHGTDDESCPIRWSRQTLAALEQAGKDAPALRLRGRAPRVRPRLAAVDATYGRVPRPRAQGIAERHLPVTSRSRQDRPRRGTRHYPSTTPARCPAGPKRDIADSTSCGTGTTHPASRGAFPRPGPRGMRSGLRA